MTRAAANRRNDVYDLPLINVAGLRSGNLAEIRKIADALGYAARDIGFLRIHGHGIDPDLIEATYQASKTFFTLTPLKPALREG